MCSEREARRFDAVVIGGGLLGCMTARNLCRWKLSAALLEAREDLCTGVSKANTAIVYPGYDHKPGTLKAELTVRANARFDALCRELDVPFSRCGSLMLSYGSGADAVLREKYANGIKNGVPGLRLLGPSEALALESALAPGLSSALWAPTAGTVDPWQLGIAAGENARDNGAELFFDSPVRVIRQDREGYLVETDRARFACRAVVNCAGLAADQVQQLLFPCPVHIAPTAGDYLVLDRRAAGTPAHILEYEPEDGGKGLTAVPTVAGNLLLGPTEREPGTAFATTEEGLAWLREQARAYLPGIDPADTIRSFAALRPNPRREDGGSIGSFVIEHPAPGFWSLIGIKTPGLTCSDELGSYVAERLAAELGAEKNEAFDPKRRGIRRAHGLSAAQRRALIAEDPDYGEILCFCQDVTRAEAREAIRRGAVTVDGIKRRTGAAMGPCQGSRCQQKLTALLTEELGLPIEQVRKGGAGSEILGGVYGEL